MRAFQSAYGLSVDGVVGPLTWNKIYEVYTDLINGLLTSDQRGVYPGTPLRVGGTGRAVRKCSIIVSAQRLFPRDSRHRLRRRFRRCHRKKPCAPISSCLA